MRSITTFSKYFISKRFISLSARQLKDDSSKKFQPSFLSENSKKNPFMTHTVGPPKLPEEEQEEFERLQKIANSQASIEEYNAQANAESNSSKQASDDSTPNLKNDIGAFSPEYLKTIPEFQGETNPATGEVGGPKQEPLRHGDWAYNGRVTDF
ncbi:hypothetical protein PACTADRAFT_48710 [Pachysolen tannophilus NRRL Y-2460]|uniref:Succinate dehydrogenase assembly factor 4, mitochondrial n=1 Tax=Pachysolen tannophilus NRRL Y-2460 TaxID=669874 RepID=A0A1E4TYT5_PACTA|nr:hypothetical protein PACTADRAFT_48710 [Pachysolen tannophilus NRRL Y-2460]